VRRHELEHIIRAAAAITDETDFVCVGSQAVLGQYPNAPPDLLVSNEVDIYPERSPDKADLIDGAIGAGSLFEEQFGYYADGVGPETARLPAGWRKRAVVVTGPNTHGARALCPDISDLAVAKLYAGREKDRDWIAAAARARLIRKDVMMRRLATVEATPEETGAAAARLDVWLRSP
jgi:hypothetical protein